jgi:nicotinamide mononucleotide transporter
MSPTEVLGFLTGAVNVWLLARQNIWNWPVGIANNALYLVLFVRSGLYGDAGLQAVYIALAVYGWWAWLRLRTGAAPEGPELSVARTPTRTWTWLAPATLAAFFTLTWFLRRFTDSTVPRWDALTTALSLAATYGQCRKYIESW